MPSSFARVTLPHVDYKAKHPGAELDIFPHAAARNPVFIAYTATSWRQLLRPISGIDMPPWPSRPSDVAFWGPAPSTPDRIQLPPYRTSAAASYLQHTSGRVASQASVSLIRHTC
jgi:hypothetical protein